MGTACQAANQSFATDQYSHYSFHRRNQGACAGGEVANHTAVRRCHRAGLYARLIWGPWWVKGAILD
eukprot:212345-Chlamydomonas_euryale.AAC.1